MGAGFEFTDGRSVTAPGIYWKPGRVRKPREIARADRGRSFFAARLLRESLGYSLVPQASRHPPRLPWGNAPSRAMAGNRPFAGKDSLKPSVAENATKGRGLDVGVGLRTSHSCD
ncbi:hypothetical protein VTK26DRAFT_3531 [Humicola hyalothermophila]